MWNKATVPVAATRSVVSSPGGGVTRSSAATGGMCERRVMLEAIWHTDPKSVGLESVLK